MEGNWRETPKYTAKSMLLALSMIFLGILACVAVTTLAADEVCHRSANIWIPPYPGAQVISEQYTFARPFGIGATRQMLHTPDELNTVSRWYIDVRVNASLAGEENPFAILNYYVAEAEGGGTTILRTSECATQ